MVLKVLFHFLQIDVFFVSFKEIEIIHDIFSSIKILKDLRLLRDRKLTSSNNAFLVVYTLVVQWRLVRRITMIFLYNSGYYCTIKSQKYTITPCLHLKLV